MTYIDTRHPGACPAGGLRPSNVATSEVGERSGRNSKSLTNAQYKPPPEGGVFYLVLDDDLLSHGEAPHYHRRCIVSLLRSEWDQVVPMLYGRQAIRLLRGC